MTKSDDGKWVQVRVWVFALMSLLATVGTLLSGILLYTIHPVKVMAESNNSQLIKLTAQQEDMERRLTKNEQVLETLSQIKASIEVIKNDIEHLKNK